MPYIPGVRNFTNVRHQALREKIDMAHQIFHDELAIAYYDFWSQGEAKAFPSFIAANRQWDVQATEAENEAQHVALLSFLTHAYNIMFHQVNVQDADYAESEYNDVYDNSEPPVFIGKRDQLAIAAISDLISDSPYITLQQVQACRQWFVQWVKGHTGYDITM